MAAFDLNSDTWTVWNPGITNGSYVAAIAVSAGRVYLGGFFSVINGFNRTNFVALDASTAEVLPLVANADSYVYGLAATSNLVFIAGNFGAVAGQTRHALAAIDVNSNTLTSWNPNSEFYAKAISVFGNTVYLAGPFLHAGGQTTRSIAAYPLALVGSPVIVSNSTQRLSNGALQFRLTALGVPQATVQFSTNLTTWQPLQTVPLVAGNGLFADSDAINHPLRFYRVSVP